MAQLQLEMLAAPADSALLISRSATKVPPEASCRLQHGPLTLLALHSAIYGPSFSFLRMNLPLDGS